MCGHAGVAVQTLAVHEPSGSIENVVLDVTSPSGLPAASNAAAVNACDPPATIVSPVGLITM